MARNAPKAFLSSCLEYAMHSVVGPKYKTLMNHISLFFHCSVSEVHSDFISSAATESSYLARQ